MSTANDLQPLRSAIDGDRRRLADALGLRPHNGRFFCPICQADGRPHADGDFSTEAGYRCHKCGWSGDGFGLVRELKGCDFPAAVEFVRNVYSMQSTRPQQPAKKKNTLPTWDSIAAAAEAFPRYSAKLRGATVTKIYQCYGSGGTPQGAEVRYRMPDGSKECRPFKHEGGRWHSGAPDTWALYGLPDLPVDGAVYVPEGPKCADAMREIGLLAVASFGGASGARKTSWTPLQGRDVVLMPDNDPAGETYATTVVDILTAQECRVKILRLAGLPVSGDVADWITARPDASPDTLQAEIEALAEAAPQPEATATDYYDAQRKEYLVHNSEGLWNRFTETQFKRILKGRGMSASVGKGAVVSEVDEAILETQDKRSLVYSGELAGWRAGMHTTDAGRILVTRGFDMIEPGDGDFPNMRCFLETLLGSAPEQYPVLLGWMKIARQSLLSGVLRPGQALAIAGPHDTGKSFFQVQILTKLLGGRKARPYGYMSGRTDFNSDLFYAEHLAIEDDVPSSKLQDRRAFGARIKEVTANEGQRLHAKNRDAIMLNPFWRLSITVNDEPENLMILPPLDESLEDKLILLKATAATLPCETESSEGRKRCLNTMLSELPAFVAFLDRYEIPDALRGGRYGVKEFHHPDLLKTLADLAPESRLAELIDQELFTGELCLPWSGRAADLEQQLTSSDSCGYEARRLLSFNTACGVYLARLGTKHPDRYERRHTSAGNAWSIQPPVFDRETAKSERGERLFRGIYETNDNKGTSDTPRNTTQPPECPSPPSQGNGVMPEGWDRTL